MFNLGFTEVIFLVVIALIFVGPKQLPELVKNVVRFVNEIKRTTSDITQSISSPTNYIRERVEKEIDEVKNAILEDDTGPKFDDEPQALQAEADLTTETSTTEEGDSDEFKPKS